MNIHEGKYAWNILTVVPEVVAYLRSMSPVWRDLQTGKRDYIL